MILVRILIDSIGGIEFTLAGITNNANVKSSFMKQGLDRSWPTILGSWLSGLP